MRVDDCFQRWDQVGSDAVKRRLQNFKKRLFEPAPNIQPPSVLQIRDLGSICAVPASRVLFHSRDSSCKLANVNLPI